MMSLLRSVKLQAEKFMKLLLSVLKNTINTEVYSTIKMTSNKE